MDTPNVFPQNPTNHLPNTEATRTIFKPIRAPKTSRDKILESQCTLDEITTAILLIMENFTHNFIEIGKLLNDAKKQLVKHGEWLKWLSDSVCISPREAERYMKVARAYPSSPSLAKLGITKAELLLSIADNKREDFINSPHEINGEQKYVTEMSVRELKRVIKKETEPDSDCNLPIDEPEESTQIQEFLSNIESALKHMNSIMNYLKHNTNDVEITKKFSGNICYLSEIADECVSLINSEALTEENR